MGSQTYHFRYAWEIRNSTQAQHHNLSLAGQIWMFSRVASPAAFSSPGFLTLV